MPSKQAPSSFTLPLLLRQSLKHTIQRGNQLQGYLKESQEMDQRENQLHSLGICNRLLNFITKKLAAVALMPTIFGCFLCRGLEVCRWFFNFIIQSLAAQAMKPLTLGPPVHQDSPQVPNSNASQNSFSSRNNQNLEAVAHEWPCESLISSQDNVELEQANPLASYSSTSNDLEEEGKELPPIQDSIVNNVSSPYTPEKTDSSQQKGPPKKTVSINDRAEVVIYPSKDKKRKKATDKLPSMEKEKDDQEPKPLKSILKVGSFTNNKVNKASSDA